MPDLLSHLTGNGGVCHSDSITVRIPQKGSHKDPNYNPFRTTGDDKTIRLPAKHLSDFSRLLASTHAGPSKRFIADLHPQQIFLMAAEDYLRTCIQERRTEMAGINQDIHLRNSKLNTIKAQISELEFIIGQRDNESAEACRALGIHAACEQKAGRDAAEEAGKLKESEESIRLTLPLWSYLFRQLAPKTWERTSTLGAGWESLAQWAESDLVDLSLLLSSAQANGCDVEKFASAFHNGNGRFSVPFIPDLSLQEWEAATEKIVSLARGQSDGLARSIDRYETERQSGIFESNHLDDLINGRAPHNSLKAITFNLMENLDNRLRQKIESGNRIISENGGQPIELSSKVIGLSRLRRAKAIQDLLIDRASSSLKLAKSLKTIADEVQLFDEQMRHLLELNASLKELEAKRSELKRDMEAPLSEINSLEAEQKKIRDLISPLESDLQLIQAALDRMGETFKQKQKQAASRKAWAENRAVEIKEQELKKIQEDYSFLVSEKARLESIIYRTKPKLLDELWRKDRFKFCKSENKHLIWGEFESRVLDLADLYIQNGGKLTDYALDKKYEASRAIHWETDFDKYIARLALTSDRNYRLLLYLGDVTDPKVLYIGAHSKSDRFLDEKVRGKNKDVWVPEWHKGLNLFGDVLKPAIEAYHQLAEIEPKIQALEKDLERLNGS